MQVETYNAAAALWQEVRGALAEALELTAGGADVWRTFWAAQQRFFKLLCVSLKTPTVVAAAKEALAADMAVVIGLQSTGAPAALTARGPAPPRLPPCLLMLRAARPSSLGSPQGRVVRGVRCGTGGGCALQQHSTAAQWLDGGAWWCARVHGPARTTGSET